MTHVPAHLDDLALADARAQLHRALEPTHNSMSELRLAAWAREWGKAVLNRAEDATEADDTSDLEQELNEREADLEALEERRDAAVSALRKIADEDEDCPDALVKTLHKIGDKLEAGA